MRAALFYDRGDVRIETVADPAPGDQDVVLKITACGICGTDAHEYAHGPVMFPVHERHPVTGHLGPLVPGHEFAGTVVARGRGVAGLDEGSLVVSGAGISCGQCHWCLRHRTNLCERYVTAGLQRHGGLAQFVCVPATTCIDAGAYGLPADTAGLGQPMSIAVHAMRRGRPAPGDVSVVLGVGGIGSFLTYALAQMDVTTVVSDPSPDRLDIARAIGAQHCLPTVVPEEISAFLTDGSLVPTVIYEVSGTPSGLRTAMSLAPRGCRVVLVGLQATPDQTSHRDVSLREIELIGTNAHVVGADMPEALRLLSSRPQGWRDVAPTALDLDHLVADGLQPLANGSTSRIKTLIDPWALAPRDTIMT